MDFQPSLDSLRSPCMKGRQHHRRIIISICCNGVVAGSQSLFGGSNRSSFMPACSPGIFPLPSRAWKSSEDYTTIQICKAAFTLPPKQEISSLHQASVEDTSSHVFCCLFGICKCSFSTSRPVVAAGSLRLRCKLHVSGSPKPFLRRSGGRPLDSFSVSALL